MKKRNGWRAKYKRWARDHRLLIRDILRYKGRHDFIHDQLALSARACRNVTIQK